MTQYLSLLDTAIRRLPWVTEQFGIEEVGEVLKNSDIASSTLEIIGDKDILKQSVNYPRGCGL